MARKFTVREVNSNTREEKVILDKVDQKTWDNWFNSNRPAIAQWRVTRYDSAAKEINVTRVPGMAFSN